ncbi:hypothetical protein M5X00_24075 [Paenibacillus alvei]|uniref:Uncharacterized protein n=1 Tax=Paenibacillus alvei TaxID=44250 RepID=A0ABT4GRU4_PAEAL|nr:hypothetical protein [Paenibacillus alvei]MCY9757307.1 hypothetical protein [Paenibacillus alvei]MCY9759162.1 hypothetical protein [Paenibacillus alvei]MCY9770379.1 hypothetical protein [Paenibacillus alvei]
MDNPLIAQPNFVVLRRKEGKGPIYKVTICKRTLNVIGEEVFGGIPDEWSVQDFFDLMDEGKRFFNTEKWDGVEA